MPFRDDDETLEARRARLEHDLREVEARLARRRLRVRLPLLAQVEVASPCDARWEDMHGDERVRYCGHCDRDVFDLSACDAEEAEAILSANRVGGDEPCVRLYRRADGTVLTRDCPDRARARWARVRARAQWAAKLAVGVGIAVAPVVALIGPALGRSRVRQARSDAMTVRAATEMYLAEDPTRPCPTVDVLVDEPMLHHTVRTSDPWGHPFEIHCPGDVEVSSRGLRCGED